MQSSVIAECFIYYRSWNLVAAQEHCNLQVIVSVKQWRCREKYSNHVHDAANALYNAPGLFSLKLHINAAKDLAFPKLQYLMEMSWYLTGIQCPEVNQILARHIL